MTDAREQWDRKYREDSHTNLTPDPFLIDAYQSYVEPLLAASPARRAALDLAGGVGRHALWLAERGWQVSLLDISAVGADLASKHATERHLPIDVQVADVSTMPWPQAQYDLIAVFFYLERALFPAISAALRSGGLLIYKTYTREHRKLSGGKGPSHPMHLLEPNELLKAFSDLQILQYRETVIGRGVAELVARKP